MAEPKAEELPLAANGEVKAYDRLGNKITVPKEKVGELYGMGGRVAARAEVQAQVAEEQYQKQSTLTKVATVASMAGPAGWAGHAYLRGQGAVLPPELEAYQQGVSGGFTGGLASVGMKEAVRLAGGDAAAKAYADTAEVTKQAHGGAYAAGEIAGFIGGAVAGGPKAGLGSAGKIIPSVGIGAVGNAVEHAAASGLAGVAKRGVIGRAIATGGSLAARGAAEGALYAGAQQVSEDVLGDKEVAADKLFASMGLGALAGGAGGGVLGFGGSLAASGVKAAGGAALGGLSRVLRKGEQVATDVAAKGEGAAATGSKGLATLADEAAGAAKAVGIEPAAEVGAVRKALGGDVNAKAKAVADDLAFNALGTTRKIADKANREVEGGSRAVGEYVNRRILKPSEEGATLVGQALKGRADDLLPMIQADKAKLGAEIGDLVKANPVRVPMDEVLAPAKRIVDAMNKDPSTIGAGKLLNQKVVDTVEAFTNSGALKADGTIDLAEMYYARAKMETVARELGARGETTAKKAVNEWLRDVDGLLVNKLDEAAKAAGQDGAKEAIRGLKRDYQLASWAEKAAKDGSDRISGNNIFGIREGIGAAVGMAMGSPIGGLATAIGGKVLRERGSAAGAYLLTRMAEMGTLTRAVTTMDDLIGKASTGLLSAPVKGPLPELPKGSVRTRAESVMARVAAFQADPESFINRVTRQTEAMGVVAPNVAASVVQRHVDAASFLASKVPPVDRDPLDPHPAPHLTDAQAHEIAQYSWYLDKPARFFEEAGRGKLTFEGAEVARVLMPGAFAQLQEQVLSGMADSLARGVRLPFAQREKVGLLLGVPATPSQRPEHMALLQQNVSVAPAAGQGPTPPQAQGPKRPVQIRTQQSALDRLETEGPGRR